MEIAASLDTSSCINAFRRFLARRGTVKTMRSDNGTNLVGAQKELKVSLEQWNQAHIGRELQLHGVKWDFNPPAASHFGGVWERLIRLVRKVLYSLLREQVHKMDDEGLYTLLCEVESILNGRPITQTCDKPNDLDALTPNHLLLLEDSENLPVGIFEKRDSYSHRRWRHVQHLVDVFWKRWSSEYLPLLQERQKWLQPQRNLKIDDVVLILEGPRGYWTMARVLEVLPDRRGLVRVVKLKTPTSTLERPIHKLVLLLEADGD